VKILDKIFADLKLSEAQQALIPFVVPAAIREITAEPHR